MKDKLNREIQPGQMCYFDMYKDTTVLMFVTKVTRDKITGIVFPLLIDNRAQQAVVSTSTQNHKFKVTNDFRFEKCSDDQNEMVFGKLIDLVSGEERVMSYSNSMYHEGDNDRVEKALSIF